MLEGEMRLLSIAIGNAEAALKKWRWRSWIIFGGLVLILLLLDHRLNQIARNLKLIADSARNCNVTRSAP